MSWMSRSTFIAASDLGCSNVYEVVLAAKLVKLGLNVERQVPVAIQFDGMASTQAFRADLIVNRKVIVELKSVEQMQAVSAKQLLTYLRLTNCRLGLLINFGEKYLKDGLKRVANGFGGHSPPPTWRRSGVA